MEEVVGGTVDSNERTERLLEKAQAGDNTAFDELCQSYRERMAHFIRSQLGARLRGTVELEDILQDMFIKAYESINHFEWRGEDSFVHWLGVIAENAIRQVARRARPPAVGQGTFEVEGGGDSQGTIQRRHERFDRLQEALDSLDPDSRRVIVLARIEGLPIKEVAKRMGRSPNATSILLYRAAIKLKGLFGETESLSLPYRHLKDRGTEHES